MDYPSAHVSFGPFIIAHLLYRNSMIVVVFVCVCVSVGVNGWCVFVIAAADFVFMGSLVGKMHTRGIEPRSQAWKACMMPLHYVCC